MTNLQAQARTRTVLITGANGYIGSAVCRAFLRAGWRTFGLVRRPEAARSLMLLEAIPVLGSFSNLGFLNDLFEQVSTFDAIVSCTEQIPGYAAHFAEAIAFVRALAEKSNENGVRPLVLWSSGCKDYGTTDLHGSPGLAPHTEQSPLNPPEILTERTGNCLKVFDYDHLFDAVVLRPTCVFGYSSSYYGSMFDYAASEAAKGAKTLRIPGNPNSIMHALHVDDCGEAYVFVAQHATRADVTGQVFNISGRRYETLREVALAFSKEYGFDGVRYVPVEDASLPSSEGLQLLLSFSQWVGSEKIRRMTGWNDRRGQFSEAIDIYRKSYDATKEDSHMNIVAVQKRAAHLRQEPLEGITTYLCTPCLLAIPYAFP